MEITVNGVTLHYEKTGEGRPLFLLHGNGEDHTIFDQAAKVLHSHFAVYMPDTRGHGKSAYEGELHYADFAADLNAMIEALQLEDVAVYGFSDGGITALLAAMDSSRITSVITSGANTRPETVKQPLRTLIALSGTFAHDPKMRLMQKEPDITADMLKKIQAETLVLAGAHDLVEESDTRFIASCIPHASLRILQSESHGSYIVHDRRIGDLLLAYLNHARKGE